MLVHHDHDSGESDTIDYQLPDKIDNIDFTYDGGRLSIYINGEEIYKSLEGTRDCSIELIRDEK